MAAGSNCTVDGIVQARSNADSKPTETQIRKTYRRIVGRKDLNQPSPPDARMYGDALNTWLESKFGEIISYQDIKALNDASGGEVFAELMPGKINAWALFNRWAKDRNNIRSYTWLVSESQDDNFNQVLVDAGMEPISSDMPTRDYAYAFALNMKWPTEDEFVKYVNARQTGGRKVVPGAKR